jgi:hypothetical protein
MTQFAAGGGGQGSNLIPSIRGISSAQTDPGNDANVSIYVDGVYEPDMQVDLPDVSRVQVLKGRQGTIFGRNATGGAIRIFAGYAYRNCMDRLAFQVLNGNTVARLYPGAVIPTQSGVYAANQMPTEEGQISTGGLRVNLDTDIGQFTSTLANKVTSSDNYKDQDASMMLAVEIWKRQNTWSEELIYNSRKFGDFEVTGRFLTGAFSTTLSHTLIGRNARWSRAFGATTSVKLYRNVRSC